MSGVNEYDKSAKVVPINDQKPEYQITPNLYKADCMQQGLFWVYIGFMIVYGIFMVSLMVSSDTDLTTLKESENFNFALQTLKLWNKGFIIDIKASSAGCPDNYQELIDFKWAGTQQGCNCPYVVEKGRQNFIIKGQCTSQLLNHNCYDVQQLEGQYMPIWRNNVRLCILRDIFSLYNSPMEICERNNTDYRRCGENELSVCIRGTTPCPITSVQKDAVPNIATSTTIDTYQYIDFNDTTRFYFSRMNSINSRFPISVFKLSEYSFCSHLDEQNISPKQKGDFILYQQRRENCPNLDQKAVLLDTMGQEDLFQSNLNVYQITREMPAYPRPTNDYSWVLGYIPYPIWTLECRTSINYKMSFANGRFQLNEELYNAPLVQYFTIGSIVVVSMIMVLIQVRRKIIRRREILRMRRLKMEEQSIQSMGSVLVPYSANWARNTWILIAIDRIAKIIHVPIIFIAYFEVEKALKWFDDVMTKNCSDDVYQLRIHNQYRQYLQTIFDYYASMLGLWWFLFIIDLAYLIFRFLTDIQPAQTGDVLVMLDYEKQEIIQEKVKPKVEVVESFHDEDSEEEEEENNDFIIFDDDDGKRGQKKKKKKGPDASSDEIIIFDDDDGVRNQKAGASPPQDKGKFVPQIEDKKEKPKEPTSTALRVEGSSNETVQQRFLDDGQNGKK